MIRIHTPDGGASAGGLVWLKALYDKDTYP